MAKICRVRTFRCVTFSEYMNFISLFVEKRKSKKNFQETFFELKKLQEKEKVG